MNIPTISTKELRENFSGFKRTLQRGQSLVLLYRSRPIAEIKPIRSTAIKPRIFTQKQINQWIADDQLSTAQRTKINAILNRLPR